MTTVSFKTLPNFLSELALEKGRIAEGIVRFEIGRMPEQPERISFQVGVCATALRIGLEYDVLLEFMAETGCDDSQADIDDAGTIKALALQDQLKNFCECNGLEMRPGKIEVF